MGEINAWCLEFGASWIAPTARLSSIHCLTIRFVNQTQCQIIGHPTLDYYYQTHSAGDVPCNLTPFYAKVVEF